MWHGRGRWDEGGWQHEPWGWHGRAFAAESHDTQAVELQGAKSADMDLDIPAGQLTLSGGSSHLMDADFRYGRNQEKPTVEYSVTEGRGQLRVTQDGNHWHTQFGTEDDEWNMRVTNGVPVDLHLQMGAGQSNLRLNGVDLKNLDVHMGAGQLDLDLTGERKNNVDGTIEGGVGQATIRLPKDVGVHVDASGGIGSVDARGLKQEGSSYVNESYGKTPTKIELTVHGGVGEIRLIQE
jgi:HSP20 family molecular chaperone IbpA